MLTIMQIYTHPDTKQLIEYILWLENTRVVHVTNNSIKFILISNHMLTHIVHSIDVCFFL